MIEKLKKKIFFVIWGILLWVFVGILLIVNITNYRTNILDTKKMLVRLAEIDQLAGKNDLPIPDEELEKKEPMNRNQQFFVVTVDQSGNWKVITDHSVLYSEEEKEYLIDSVLEETKTQGRIGDTMYQVQEDTSVTRIAFLDMSLAFDNQRHLYFVSAIILVFGMIASLVIARLLSLWLVKPVKEAFEKQKAFISDAGHELKTPITVINANIDMMESEYGDHKYLHYIKNEIMKMNSLVQSLLVLAKIENTEIKTEFSDFNLSKAIVNAALPFESVAFEHGLSLQEDVQTELMMSGNESQMKQVVAILVDNAIKHANEGSSITVSLRKEKGKHLLSVHNYGESIPKDDIEKIFEKFYRGDKSRNRDAGRYGLGLAIAKNIIMNHHGKIWVNSQGGETTFYINV